MADEAGALQLADRRIPGGGDWLSPQELGGLTADELVRRTNALKPLLAAHSREAERLRRPVDDVWAAIRRSGVFYHFVPKIYGGLELDVESYIDIMLPLAEGCSSTGWVTAFCVEHNWMLSQFPKEAQDEIFADFPYVIAPGVTNPPGAATPIAGGYKLTGRWRWGTGVMHADWILANGIVPGESPPRVLFFAFPAVQATVLDTWQVDGMIGTGSNDIVVRDLFVPAHRVVDFGDMRDGCAPGSALHAHNPIYRMAMGPFLAVAAAIPALGAARAAVAYFAKRLQERVLVGAGTKQVEKPAAQMRLAQADVMTRTAELLIRHAARANVDLGAEPGGGANAQATLALRLKVAFAVDLCRQAVRLVCEASGASAHSLDNPLQRALRDVNVISSHMIFDLDSTLESQGRAMIGLPPNSII